MWFLAAIGALVATFASGPSAACTCAGPGPIVFPRDGEIDVPRDAVIVGRFSSLVSLTEVETGVEIEVERTPLDPAWGEWFVARPVALLAPSTRHRVIVDDDEAHFSTGATLASAPEPLPLAAVRLAAWSPVEQEGSCDELWRDDPFDREGRRTYACLDLEPPPLDVVMLSYSFVPLDGDGEPAVRWIAPWDDAGIRQWPTLLRAHSCEVRAPPFRPGERWQVAVTAWNAAFDPSGGAAVEATVAACDSRDSCEICVPAAEGPAPPVGRPGPGDYPSGTVGRAPGCTTVTGSSWPGWTILPCLITCLLTLARGSPNRRRRSSCPSLSRPGLDANGLEMPQRALLVLLGMLVMACGAEPQESGGGAPLARVAGDDVTVRLHFSVGLPAEVYDTIGLELEGDRLVLTETDPTAGWDLDDPEQAHDAELLRARRGGNVLATRSVPRAFMQARGLQARVVDLATSTMLAETTLSSASCADADAESLLVELEESVAVAYTPDCTAWLIAMHSVTCRFLDPEKDYGMDGLLIQPACP